MKQDIKAITVYGASSSQINPVYFDAASKLGKLLADHGIICINGGGNKGLMAAVTDAALESGGKVCGIIPQFMIDEGWVHTSLSERIATSDMHTRKQLMAEKSDGCIALPGGIGTMEELLEVITWKQLGLYTKPIIILNINGFYNELLSMLKKAEEEHFMHHKHSDIWQIATTPEEAFSIIFNQPMWEENPRSFAAL